MTLQMQLAVFISVGVASTIIKHDVYMYTYYKYVYTHIIYIYIYTRISIFYLRMYAHTYVYLDFHENISIRLICVHLY